MCTAQIILSPVEVSIILESFVLSLFERHILYHLIFLLCKQFHFQGVEAMSKRHYTLAIDLFTNAINLLSLDDRKSYGYILFYLRANAYMHMEQYELALKDSETSISLNDKFSKAYCEKGDALFALHRYESSVDAYNSAELIF